MNVERSPGFQVDNLVSRLAERVGGGDLALQEPVFRETLSPAWAPKERALRIIPPPRKLRRD